MRIIQGGWRLLRALIWRACRLRRRIVICLKTITVLRMPVFTKISHTCKRICLRLFLKKPEIFVVCPFLKASAYILECAIIKRKGRCRLIWLRPLSVLLSFLEILIRADRFLFLRH